MKTTNELQQKNSKNIIILVTAFVITMTLVGIFSNISGQLIKGVTSHTNQLIKHQAPELRKITSLQNKVSVITNNLYAYYATLDRKYYLENTTYINEMQNKINFDKIPYIHASYIDELEVELAAFAQSSNALDQEMLLANRNWDKLREHLSTAQTKSSSIKQSLTALSQSIRNRVEENSISTQAEVMKLNQLQLGFSLIVLFASGIIIFSLYRRIKDRSALFKHAYFNNISQLPNRKYFEKNFAKNTDERTNISKSYLILGLDRFALITGSLGYIVGDKLIQSVSAWLYSTLSQCNCDYELYHFTGASFLVVLTNANNVHTTNNVANALLELSTIPMDIGDREMSVNCSLGMFISNDNNQDVETLLRNLDAALREARKNGGNCISQYTNQLSIDATNWLETEQLLQYAVEKRELELFYQPKINAVTGKICSSEALLRWHQNGDLVSPAIFIPIAESSRLIIKIGHWVLQEACKQWVEWQAKGLPPLPVAVNISALQFQDPKFPEQVQTVINQTGIPPEMLELEITEEAAAFEPQKVVNIMNKLKTIGVKLAIDDFGTGYSSLSHLKRFPVDVLKIDRSFVKDMQSDTSTEASIVKLILKLAQQLNVKVVAEGVETEVQYQQLRRWGCDYIQGFLFSRPVPANDFFAMINKENETVAISNNG